MNAAKELLYGVGCTCHEGETEKTCVEHGDSLEAENRRLHATLHELAVYIRPKGIDHYEFVPQWPAYLPRFTRWVHEAGDSEAGREMPDETPNKLTVAVDDDTARALACGAAEQHMGTKEYASGLLIEAMQGQWVSVHALMEMADEIRSRRAK